MSFNFYLEDHTDIEINKSNKKEEEKKGWDT